MSDHDANRSELPSALVRKLEARAREFFQEHRLPGASVGVVHGGDLAWAAGFGFADMASRRPPDDDTLYRVASITKTFTGTAIMQLRDEGSLHLDDPLVRHLPELAEATSPFGPLESVTIRRVLSHESGLQGDPPGTDWSTPSYEGMVADNLSRVAEIATTVTPNRQQKYSNLGYQLLGEIVARCSGMPYVEHVRERILEPLGMTRSGFQPLPEGWVARLATGYAARFLSDELSVASTPPTVWAEGGLASCVSDLARWISFQFADGERAQEAEQVLDLDTLREMHAARYLGDEAWTEAWCIAWYAVRRNDVIWIQHSGGIHGFISNVCFDPKRQVGAIVLLNGSGPASELAMDLATLAREELRPTPDPHADSTPMPATHADLLGLYLDEEQAIVVRVEWRDGALTVVDPDEVSWRPTLTPTDDPDLFVVAPGVRESGERVVFRRTDDGRVASMFLAAGTLRRLAPVEPYA